MARKTDNETRAFITDRMNGEDSMTEMHHQNLDTTGRNDSGILTEKGGTIGNFTDDDISYMTTFTKLLFTITGQMDPLDTNVLGPFHPAQHQLLMHY